MDSTADTTSDIQVVRSFVTKAPVDLKGLIRALGIEYVSTELPRGVSGAIEFLGDGYRILVNATESSQRQRFTAAHELGHYLLHRDILRSTGTLNRHNDMLFGESKEDNLEIPFSHHHEVQANRYAAEIIMPKSIVQNQYNAESDNYQELAKLFEVSDKAMQIRLNNLGLRGPVDS